MAIQLIRGLSNLATFPTGCVATIGNFDGVHLGHQALLERLKDQAKRQQLPAVVVLFEPQPAEFFAKGKAITPRLTRLREKLHILNQCGIQQVLVLRFTDSLANLTAAEFVKVVLVEGLGIKHIIVGDDFRFGKARQGDFDFLKQAGERSGFVVENMTSVMLEGERVSSTRIRLALSNAEQALVERLLGRPYTMEGRVVHGDKRGRILGFPTANIFLHRKVSPVQGIYVVRMHGLSHSGLEGVANVGTRPTVGGTRTLLEVHLLDFHQDIYGRYVRVEFCKKLRDEEYYANLELLKEQIGKDADQARAYFNAIRHL